VPKPPPMPECFVESLWHTPHLPQASCERRRINVYLDDTWFAFVPRRTGEWPLVMIPAPAFTEVGRRGYTEEQMNDL